MAKLSSAERSLDGDAGIAGTHSHIKGLGLDKNLRAQPAKDGMIGQLKAREAAGLLVEVVKRGQLGGRLVILAGPPASGKTALAIGVARELGETTPFIHLSASEVYSAERKKTEVLFDALRSCITVELADERTVYEGSVDKLDVLRVPVAERDPHHPAPDSVRITIRNGNDQKIIEAGMNIAMQVGENRLKEGDHIRVDSRSGKLLVLHGENGSKSVGSGVVRTVKETIGIPLTDLDTYASKVYSEGVFAAQDEIGSKKELDPRVRGLVDDEVATWAAQGLAKIRPGVLFIDDAHLLDLESLAALNRAAEAKLAPIIFLATNRGITKITGTDIESPMGLPRDVIDRAVIIPTGEYTPSEIRQILQVRTEVESVKMTKEAIEELTRIGAKTSLRYSIQLQSLAAQQARLKEDGKVTREAISKVADLYMDSSEVVKHLKRYETKMLR